MNIVSKPYLRRLRIPALIMALTLSMMAHVSAQTQEGALNVGVELGPFSFIATGGHETIGGLGLFGEPHLGYFLSDKFAVGATGFFYHPIDNGGSSPSVYFGGAYSYVNYHFNSGSLLSPYIGGRIGVFKANPETQFALGAQAGLLYFVSRQFSINGQLETAACMGSEGDIFLLGLGFGLSYHIK